MHTTPEYSISFWTSCVRTGKDVQSLGCKVLGHMCLDDAGGVKAATVQSGALAVIVDALRSFPDDIALQANACYALDSVLPMQPTVRDDARHGGAVLHVVRALQSRAAAEYLQFCACAALSRLTAYQPLNAAEAWGLGAFQLLLQTLETHRMSARVQERCLIAADFLVLGVRSAALAVTPSVADANTAVCAAISAVRAHPANLSVQNAACRVVNEIALTAPQLAITAAEAGAMEAMVHALRASSVDSHGFYQSACRALANMASQASAYRHRAHSAGAINALVAALTTRLGVGAGAHSEEAAGYALCCLCEADPDACALAARCGAVKALCGAIRKHGGALEELPALKILAALMSFDDLIVTQAAAAGPVWCSALAQLVIRSTPQQDNIEFFIFACEALARVTACNAAAVRSADAVLPLLHVLKACSHLLEMATIGCGTLQAVVESSPVHAEMAAERGAAAAVDAVARAHPEDAELQRSAAGIRATLARVEAQSAAAAAAREDAQRRAAAMAEALIAEEEAAQAAPQAAAARNKRSKKKRGGGGGAAGAEGAAAVGDDAARSPEPERASAAAAASLSALSVDDATAVTLSAAALRRRRRAATKAARRLSQRAGAAAGSEPAANGDAETDDDAADESAAADDAAAEAVQSDEEALPSVPLPQPAAAVAPPPPPPPMKECCVCLLDQPAAEQVVLVPCGHRCMCEPCWREQLLPRPPAARLCPICDARVEWAGRMFDA